MVTIPENSNYNGSDICLCLHLAGFQIDHIIVRVNLKMTLRHFVETIVDKFNLEQVDSCGFVGYHVLSIGDRPGPILKYFDEEGNAVTFEDLDIGKNEDDGDICLFYAPGGSSIYTVPMENTPIYTASDETQNKKDEMPGIHPINEGLPILLTIDGNPSVTVQVKVNDPHMPIRDLIADFVGLFNITMVDSRGHQLKYLLGMESTEDDGEPLILEFEDNLGREQNILDYNVQPGNHLHLIGVPVPKTDIEIVKTSHEDEYVVFLTIDLTEYENVKVKINDVCKPIREQIASIVEVLDLPKVDNGGNPIHYLPGLEIDGEDEPEILDFEDEEGRELALVDYHIQPGDHLHLIPMPVCGVIWSNVLVVIPRGVKPFETQTLKIFEVDKVSGTDSDVCRLYGWVEEIIKRLVSQFNLPEDRQYYLAKLNKDSDSNLRFYFLNGEEGSSNGQKSIFDYTEDLRKIDDQYPDVILFPVSGINKRILNEIEKYYNRVPRF